MPRTLPSQQPRSGLARSYATVLGDGERAEALVVDVVVRACIDPGTVVTGAGSLRRDLAQLICLRSSRTFVDAPASDLALTRIADTPDLGRQRRSAVALVQCGDHTVQDVADLLGLSVTAVATLLISGLQDLEAADRRGDDDSLRLHRDTGRSE